MRTRHMSLEDHGVFPEDEEKLKEYCKSMDKESSLRLFQCAISAAPGLEILIYESLVTGCGYRTLIKKGRDIPATADDFYAYRRKTLAEFYDWLRLTGKMC